MKKRHDDMLLKEFYIAKNSVIVLTKMMGAPTEIVGTFLPMIAEFADALPVAANQCVKEEQTHRARGRKGVKSSKILSRK